MDPVATDSESNHEVLSKLKYTSKNEEFMVPFGT